MMSIHEQIRKIYDQIPDVHCKGLCHKECTIIPMSRAERVDILATGSQMPRDIDKTNVCSALAGTLEHIPVCSALTADKRCSIYENRPMVCRLYGTDKRIQCPHGCKPNVWLPRDRVNMLLDKMDAIDPNGDMV